MGGLYGVRTPGAPDTELLCRARGILRRERLTPTVGDDVWIRPAAPEEQTEPEDADKAEESAVPFGGKRDFRAEKAAREKRKQKTDVRVDYVIDEICERRSLLIRPPAANLDYLFAVIPCASPEPDLLTADKLTVIAENYGIESVIVLNKADLNPGRAVELAEIYRTAGYRVFPCSASSGEGVSGLAAYLEEISSVSGSGRHVSGAFAGVSGAGKSTLMTALFPTLHLTTGEVSRKTERGRHTTRHVELYPVSTGGGTFWIADTPGFSLLDFTRFDFFPYGELAQSFREFGDCLGKCRYTKCTHLREEGCAVLEKMKNGGVSPSRHESYVRIFEEQRSVPEWKRKAAGEGR